MQQDTQAFVRVFCGEPFKFLEIHCFVSEQKLSIGHSDHFRLVLTSVHLFMIFVIFAQFFRSSGHASLQPNDFMLFFSD